MAFYDESPYSPAYQHRAIVSGKNGAVAGASPQAAIAGLRVLQNGGNAVDAAVAIAGVENVTLPMACGLGGEVFEPHEAPPSRLVIETDRGRDRRSDSSGSASPNAPPHASRIQFYGRTGM